MMDEIADAQAAAAAAAGDTAAAGELAGRYLGPVFDFAATVTGDAAGAARIAADSVVTAIETAGVAPFRAQVFAIAHGAAVRQAVRAREGAVPARDEPAWRAARQIDPRQLAILDLRLRQGCGDGETAAALRTSPASAAVAWRRIQAAAGEALAAAMLLGDAGHECTGLRRATAGAAASRVAAAGARHVATCSACQAAKLDPAAALAAYAALPPLPLPEGGIAAVLARLDPSRGRRRSEHPAPPGPARRGRLWPLRYPLVPVAGLSLAAAAVLAAVLVPGSPLNVGLGSASGPPAAADGSPSAVPIATEPARATATPRAPSPTATAGDSAGRPPTGTPTAASTPTAGPPTPAPTPSVAATLPPATPTPSPTATASPTASPTVAGCIPRLAANVTMLVIAPGGTGSFLVFDAAVCGPGTFGTSVGAAWLVAAPAQGSFGTGQQATVIVEVLRAQIPGEGVHTASATASAPGAGAATVNVQVTLGGAPPVAGVITAACTSAQAAISAAITDDVAVASVRLEAARAGSDPLVLPMSGPDGSASGTWAVTVTPRDGLADFTIVAEDGAGHTARRTISATECPLGEGGR